MKKQNKQRPQMMKQVMRALKPSCRAKKVERVKKTEVLLCDPSKAEWK